MYGKTSKLTPALKEPQEIDTYFHFRRITKPADPDLFFSDLNQYLDNYNIRTIEGLEWNIQEDVVSPIKD